MAINHNAIVPLEEIPEMNDVQRMWIRVEWGISHGYYEIETKMFVITKCI